MSNAKCFLIADEVGLGKTRTASHIVWELSRHAERPCTLLYLASNQRISEQNIGEFTGKADFDRLAGYQQSTVCRACRAFLGENWNYSSDTAGTRQFRQIPCDRFISLWQKDQKPWCEEKAESRAYAFSPRLSFFTDDGLYYTGSEDERKTIGDVVEKINSLTPKEQDAIERSRRYFENLWKEKLDLQKLCKQKEAGGNWAFRALRAILSNAALFLLRPDVVVLDEFQRFTGVLKEVGTPKYSPQMGKYVVVPKYSLRMYLDFLREMKLELPYILLLSATPYDYDHRGEGNDPFGDFKTLQAQMQALGADISQPAYYLSRAERRMFFQEEDRKLYQTVNEPLRPEENHKYLLYLSQIYRSGVNIQQTYLSETPNYWLFAHGYKEKNASPNKIDTVSQDGQLQDTYLSMCKNEKLAKVNPYYHGRMQLLLRESHWEDLQHRLWLAPSLCASPKGTPLGKLLVFTHYHMSARAAAYYLDRKVQETLAPGPLEDLDGLWQDLLPFVPEQAQSKEYIAKILAKFLQMKYPRRVIFASEGRWDAAAVVTYCQKYQLADVLEEYRQLLASQNANLALRLEEILGMDHLGKVKVGPEQEHALQFAVRYTDDPEQNVGHNKKFEQAILRRFNSPFYPFVLVATDTAQEGLNMHDYADRIMHWSSASSVSAFQQREGRIDRPNSRTIRCRLAYLYHMTHPNAPAIPDFKQLSKMADQITTAANIPAAKLKLAYESGIFPLWYVPAPSAAPNFPHIHRILCETIFSGEDAQNEQLLCGVKEYHKLAPELNDAARCAFLSEKGRTGS